MLNAFRHHSLVHCDIGGAGDWQRRCSTPFGITAWFTTVGSTRRQATNGCSTPFGITAWFTSSLPQPGCRRWAVLNAFRHHSLVHRILVGIDLVFAVVLNAFRHHSLVHVARHGDGATLDQCSTPFGITAWFTTDQ